MTTPEPAPPSNDLLPRRTRRLATAGSTRWATEVTVIE